MYSQPSLRNISSQGCLGGSVSYASDFGSGHDLVAREFEPHVGFCADSSEPGARFGFLSPSLSAPPPHSHSVSPSLSPSKINKHLKIKKKKHIITNNWRLLCQELWRVWDFTLLASWQGRPASFMDAGKNQSSCLSLCQYHTVMITVAWH